MNAIDAYARQVVAGELPAGKYHRLACARHLYDREREETPGFPFRFEYERADRFFRFVAKLKHYKGEWAGRFIVLEPHQKFRLGSIFAWIHPATGLRRFRTAYNEIPRKNGKSLEAATVALYVTFFDGEQGAEGYTIATKREQAKIVWTDAATLVSRSSALSARITKLASNLHRKSTSSKLEPLGADKDSTDGLNPSLIINDEFHAQKERGMIDVMETATGARQQPLNFQITTAGNDPVSPCGDQHDYATKILDGVLVDDTFFAFIAHADVEDLEGDGWLQESTWRKANPNYGVSVRPDDLRALATKAAFMESAAAAFKQKRLNVWVNTSAPWLSLDGWRAGQTTWTLEELGRARAFLGVDLSSKIDLAAVAAVIPPTERGGRWRVHLQCFTPERTLDQRARRDRAPYRAWEKAGHLRTNPGNRLDQNQILAYVLELRERLDVVQVGFDPYNAANLEQDLYDADFAEDQVVEVPQTLQQMTGPSKEFEADVLDGLVDGGTNPLFEWMVSNVVVQRDGKDNIYPTKKKSRGRIDGVIATLIARKLAAAPDDSEPAPTYEVHFFGGTQ